MARGRTSLVAAMQVGAEVEDQDLADLAAARAGLDDDPDVALAYDNLARGSRNHLRAFTSRLERLGEAYTAQHISSDELASIVASDRERGNGQRRDKGKRGGNGHGQGCGRCRS